MANAKKFCDLITADHLNTHGQEDIEGADYPVVFKDVGTGWLDCHPTASNNTEDARVATPDGPSRPTAD